MIYEKILEERIRRICAVVDSLELYKTDTDTLNRFDQALNWLPDLEGEFL